MRQRFFDLPFHIGNLILPFYWLELAELNGVGMVLGGRFTSLQSYEPTQRAGRHLSTPSDMA